MENIQLEQKLEHFFDGEKKVAVTHEFLERESTTLDQIRDAMLDVGVLLEEDLEQGIYVARVTGGRRKNYGPIIAATPSTEGVDVAGIVIHGKTKLTHEAMQAFGDALEGKPPKQKRRHTGLKFFFFLMLIVGSLAAFSYYYFLPNLVIPAQAATARYNEAVSEYNAVVPRYNEAVDGLSVENLRGFMQEAQELSEQGTGWLSVSKSVIGGNRAEKIDADAATIRAMATEVAEEILILEELRDPTEEWVAKKLTGVDGVDQVVAVTAANDPNGLLGKDGGYSSCTYFTTGLLGKDVVKGNSPVQKGVDGGGAVEVYPTLEDAQARCEYLAEFDDTILYSGSYALVGTMVIRTSCLLDDNAQYALTNNIVNSMIGT